MLIWPPQPDAFRGYWLTPGVFGLVLILAGILIYLDPDLLAYFFAAIFILVGMGLIGVAWKMRQRVTFRRLDDPPPDDRFDA
ncbi:MAG: hypothetical protein PVJ57_00435 [Phycisphaerae bacterium]|jgi:hypothetical protein